MSRKLVRDLSSGDKVNLESDFYADDGNHPEFGFEYETVTGSERESPSCIRVDFESGFSCGFPPEHFVTVEN